MNYTLKSKALTVELTDHGGTLSSIRDHEGIEYLWQGDKTYWSGQAPILFPICGSLRGDEATIGGDKRTKMPRHGLVRKQDFQCENQAGNQITFSIASDEQSLAAYPYPFALSASYQLTDKTIRVTYLVKNTGSETMPYFIGGHPGFNCPLLPQENYADYRITFAQPENCTMPTPVTETGLIDMAHRTPMPGNQTSIPLKHELFEKDAIILDCLQSRSLTLHSAVGKKGVRLDYPDFPYLILWSSSNGGDFVAIEPWTGLSTCSDEGDIFEQKRNVCLVKPGKQRAFHYAITIL